MKRNNLFFLLILLSAVVAGTLFWSVNSHRPQKGTVKVSFNKQGFSPNSITIEKGTKVIFENRSGRDFWPASDFYPGNDNYPGFDPLGPLKDGQQWQFQFDNPGEWGYHEHLSPINRGTIIVADGKSPSQVKTDCHNIDNLDYNQRQICWYKQIKEATKKEGIVGALSLFSKLYEKYPVFAGGCHDAMHLIGDEAYREYRKGQVFEFASETTYCGYGFYHGFIEAMLYTTGDYTEVKEFCESINQNLKGNIESPNAIYSCYHGIGHSTFGVHDPRLWGSEEKMVYPAIKTCESVTQGLVPEKTKQCVTGVFNALGNAYGGNEYNLKMNPDDPTWLCRKQKPIYQPYCFLDLSQAWISTTMGGFDYKFTDAAHFIAGINDKAGEEAAMFTMASDYTRLKIDILSNTEMLQLCKSVKSTLITSCIKGVELGLLNWGKPGEEYVQVLDLCNSNLLSIKDKEICFNYVFPILRTLYPKEKTDSICNDLDHGKYKKYCSL